MRRGFLKIQLGTTHIKSYSNFPREVSVNYEKLSFEKKKLFNLMFGTCALVK